MKDLIIEKLDVAIKKLKSAKMWLKEQGENEESLLGLVEDDLNEAYDNIDKVFTDLAMYEESLSKSE